MFAATSALRRSPEPELLSKIFSLAVKYREIDSNPRRDVQHFPEDNEQFPYLP